MASLVHSYIDPWKSIDYKEYSVHNGTQYSDVLKFPIQAKIIWLESVLYFYISHKCV